jgi:hypothetical protein
LNGGEWSAPQRRTTLHLALPEGKYTFEVRAMDEFGNIDPTPAKTSFELTHYPGYDHPDENYSVGEKSKEPPSPSIHSKIGILRGLFAKDCASMVKAMGEEYRFISHDEVLDPGKSPILILPSGSLRGLSDSKIFKERLKRNTLTNSLSLMML